jgi:hypothetical protein
MAAIGNSPTQQAFTPAIDYFSGNGSTTAFTLSRPVASVAQVQVTIDNVAQNPSSAFTVSANTITFTSAPLSGTNNIYVYYTSPITQVIAPGQGTVGTTQIQNGVTVNFADGTAAAPSITNDGDTNTGIFFPAADTIAFSEGGTESMRIDASGNVGIGTTSPSYRVDAVGAGSPANGIMRTSSNLTNATTKYGYYTVGHYTNATVPFGFIQGESNSTENNVHIGGGAGEITAATRIDFYTAANNSTTNGTERMRINSSGNVGIGTNSPSAFGGYKTLAIGGDSGSSTSGVLQFINNGTEGLRIVEGSTAVEIIENRNIAMVLGTNATERMRIDSSGNFSINQTPGKYTIDTTINGTGTSIANGGQTTGIARQMPHPTSNDTGTNVCGILYLAAGDTTQAVVYQDSGGNMTAFADQTWGFFSGYLLG